MNVSSAVKARDLFHGGLSIAGIARKLRISPSSVRRALVKMNAIIPVPRSVRNGIALAKVKTESPKNFLYDVRIGPSRPSESWKAMMSELMKVVSVEPVMIESKPSSEPPPR